VNTRALTLAISLLGAAAMSVALTTTSGCTPLECNIDDELFAFELGVIADLHAVARLDDHAAPRSYDGIAVGAVGTIVVWGYDEESNGDFQEASSFGTADLRGISWQPGSWWIVGDAGTVAVSGDRGQTWNPVALPTTADLDAIAHVGLRVVIVGDDVVLVQAVDGTWVDMPAPSGSWGQLRALYLHGDRLYAVGLGGVIWSTTDPLGEWVAESSGTQADLFAIGQFHDGSNDTVAAVGAAGTVVVRQSDAWNQLDTDESEDLVAYTDGYALAANGVLFNVGSGGQLTSTIVAEPGVRAMYSDGPELLIVGADGAAFNLVRAECY
jgi:photosystem II stability/assembly factor-like uncharacterized protein